MNDKSLNNTPSASTHGYILAVGMFDGLHAGHRYLLEQLRYHARQMGLKPVVMTFTNHPLEVIAPEKAPKLLSTPMEKRLLFASENIEVQMDEFSPKLRALSAADFMKKMSQKGVKAILMGYNNRFGHNAPADFAQYNALAAEAGIELVVADEYVAADGAHVSSSQVRSLLQSGDIEGANALLGHAYELSGVVAEGRQIGAELGYPTANLELCSDCKLVPASGVYVARAIVGGWYPDDDDLSGIDLHTESFPAMVNIGHHPTVGAGDLTIEAHIIDLDADIYGIPLRLELLHRLRDEQKFPSKEALISQLDADYEATLGYFPDYEVDD